MHTKHTLSVIVPPAAPVSQDPEGAPSNFRAHFAGLIHDTLGRLALLEYSLSQETDADRRLSIINEMVEVAEPLSGDIGRLRIVDGDNHNDPPAHAADADDGDGIPPEWIRDRVGKLAILSCKIDGAPNAEQRAAVWRDMHGTAAELATLLAHDCGCNELLCETDADDPFAKLAAELFGPGRGDRHAHGGEA